jgi:hypothetical protein
LDQEAKGRPVLLYWRNWNPRGFGLEPDTSPQTIEMCEKIVEDYKLSGTIFEFYGDLFSKEENQNVWGLKRKPDLITQIQAAAHKWGIF